MKIGIYFCNCGANISDKLDMEVIRKGVDKIKEASYYKELDFMCSEAGKKEFEQHLLEEKPDRVVIAACSPREHENTFMKIMSNAGINPYLMQMSNIREQVAWVTEDKLSASIKVIRYIKAAIGKVIYHEPLQKQEIDFSTDAVVIGAGPAGLKAGLSIAESGRKVTIIEKSPIIGGMPIRYEEISPNMECGPCMIEPLLGDVLHGKYSENIEILTLSEIEELVGFYGNFIVKIKQQPRYVDDSQCIGCGACIEVCPQKMKNEFNYGLNEKKAIDYAVIGGLPNVPYIDDEYCQRFNNQECTLCKDSCPMGPQVINYDDKERIIERKAGAIIVAIGSEVLDCSTIPDLSYKKLPDIYNSLEFERIIASEGPTQGKIQCSDGTVPKNIGILHCAGSMEKNHKEYCSGICCETAFKFNHIINNQIENIKIYHIYKEISVSGKDSFKLYEEVKEKQNTYFLRYRNMDDIKVFQNGNNEKIIEISDENNQSHKINLDMLVLCPAIVPSKDSEKLSEILELSRDKNGFFEEMHNKLDSAKSKLRGIFIAGTSQAPKNITESVNQGMASAGYILSGLIQGKKLELEPIVASVNEEKCSGCRTCILVCPYKAISFDDEKKAADVSSVLCQGCGTCVAACPADAIKGNHFTNRAIISELEGALSI